MTEASKTFKDYLKDVTGALNKPVTLPTFLTTPIPMPGFGKPQRRKRTRSPHGTSGRRQKDTAAPRSFILEGVLERGTLAKFAVCETEFNIDSNTWIVGSIEFGAHVKVKGLSSVDGKVATQVIVLRS